MKNFILLSSILFLFQSCFPNFGNRYLIKESGTKIKSSNINGTYRNIADTNIKNSLWRKLQLN